MEAVFQYPEKLGTFSQTTFPFIHVLTVVKLFGSFLDGSDVSLYNCSKFKGTLMCTLAHF